MFGQTKIYHFCSDCRITEQNQNFFVLSDEQTDAKTAIKTCSSFGGKLAEVTSQTSSEKIKTFLKKNLINSGKKCFTYISVI